MKPIPVMHKITAVLSALYGLVALTGGIIGYVKAGSVASLAAGGGAGVLLLAAAVLIFWRRPIAGLLAAAVVSIGLLGRFLPPVVKSFSETVEPGKEAALLVGQVMVVGGLLVLFAAALAIGRGCTGGT